MIGTVGLIVVLASTELFVSVVLIEGGDAKGVFVITEASVVPGTTEINKLFAATTPIAAAFHPSKHNIY